MEMIKVLLVDDDQPWIDALKKELDQSQLPLRVCGEATNIEEAFEGVIKHRPHLVLLDIEMRLESGFDLLLKFDKVEFEVIFVTIYAEYTIRAIKFAALDYLLKPVQAKQIDEAIGRSTLLQGRLHSNEKVDALKKNLQEPNSDLHQFLVPVPGGFDFINVGEIMYALAEGAYTRLYLKGGKKVLVTGSLGSLGRILCDHGFFRVHRGGLVNLSYIRKYRKEQGGKLLMMDNMELDIARRRKNDFMERIRK